MEEDAQARLRENVISDLRLNLGPGGAIVRHDANVRFSCRLHFSGREREVPSILWVLARLGTLSVLDGILPFVSAVPSSWYKAEFHHHSGFSDGSYDLGVVATCASDDQPRLGVSNAGNVMESRAEGSIYNAFQIMVGV